MMIKKVFININLGIKFNSFIDKKLRVWFKAKQVASILGYKKTENAINRHVSENHKRTFLCCHPETGGQQIKCCPRETQGQQNDTRGKYCIFIDEAGFYELVFKSRLPSAKMFREWVFTKVLPSIRKYGYFKMKDSRIKQRVVIDEKEYYKHQVFSKYAASKNGDIINVKTKKKIKMINNGYGYLFFSICDKKLEKPKAYTQHRFVYEVFKGPIPRFFEVDHINSIKSDNRIINLQLLTHKQNIEKSKNKPIISTCIETGKEKRFKSIKIASIEMEVNSGNITKVCKKKYNFLTSKKDGKKYSFRYLD